MEEIKILIDEIENQEFYGKLTFEFRKGGLFNIRKEQNFKPGEIKKRSKINGKNY